MVVEFIGSTGAGKSTVLRSVERCLAARVATITSADLVTGLLGLQGITHPTIRNLIQEVLGLPFAVSSLYQHRTFIANSMRLLLRNARSGVMKINNVRSLERKLGVYKLVRLMARDRIVLVDEGPVLAAHMFIYGADGPTAREIAAFVETIPLPDAIVYVRAPIEAIVKRTLLRPDPPRELSSRVRPDVARCAEAAAILFDQLAASLGCVLPILIIDNPDMDQQRQQVIAEEVARFIVDHHLKGSRSPNPALNRNSPIGVGEHRTNAL